jgi:hypothetical protein
VHVFSVGDDDDDYDNNNNNNNNNHSSVFGAEGLLSAFNIYSGD